MSNNKKRKTANEMIKNPIVRNALWIVSILIVLLVVSSLLLRVCTRHGSHRTVPDFAGMHISEASRLAKNEGLHIIINDSLFVPMYDGGTVLDQLPKGGVEVKAGRKIYVTVNSSRQKSVKVPYVAERSLRQAKNMLESAGLEIARLEYVSDIATNYVLAEFLDGRQIRPNSDVEAEIGTGVTLRVGVQAESSTAYIPKLVGLSLPRAKGRLWEMGFNVGKVSYDAGVERLERGNARVYYQSVTQGRSAALGTTVDLKLTTDARKISESEAASDAELRVILKERAILERQADSLRSLGLDPDAVNGEGVTFDSTTSDEDEFFD